LYLENRKNGFDMQAKKYSIKDWAEDDKPREKLLRKSPHALSDAELLAILINHGTPEKSALDLARDMMALVHNNLSELGKLNIKELMAFKGIGLAKAITILAALELGRRRHAAGSLLKPVIRDSKDVAIYLQSLLKDSSQEVFGAVYLNQGNRINHVGFITSGGIAGTVADPRTVIKIALEVEAVSLILYHNHPSGNLKPSKADEQLTARIREAARFFDIKVLDHLIVSEEGYLSFADEGMM
jgi:DNA repair protein RadC